MKLTLFNSDVVNKSRLAWIDYARAIAIILVLYRHIYEGLLRAGVAGAQYAWLEHANIIFYSFRMPLFFILSGAFLRRSLAKRGLAEQVGNKFRTLLYPYLVWCFIQITLQLALDKWVNADRTWNDYWYVFAFPRRIDQFWYLYALFNLSVLYMINIVKLRMPRWAHLCLGFAMYLASSYISVQHLDLGFVYDILHYYLFFAIGDVAGEQLLKKENTPLFSSWKVFFGLLPFFIVGQYYFLNKNLEMLDYLYVEEHQPLLFAAIALSGCAFIYNISFILQRYNVSKAMRVVGFHSLYIYVSHVLVASCVRLVLVRVLHMSNVPILLCIILVFAVTVPIILYNLAIQAGAWWLYSLERPKPARPAAVAEVTGEPVNPSTSAIL